jgi:dipeptidyl aminopeptidase/acylaminoacyl peptidase
MAGASRAGSTRRRAGTKRPAPLVVEIHGGPATLYGWSLMWEWQVPGRTGMSVYACNPRGSQGYGQDFLSANVRDWGDGPMRDVMAASMRSSPTGWSMRIGWA